MGHQIAGVADTTKGISLPFTKPCVAEAVPDELEGNSLENAAEWPRIPCGTCGAGPNVDVEHLVAKATEEFLFIDFMMPNFIAENLAGRSNCPFPFLGHQPFPIALRNIEIEVFVQVNHKYVLYS